MSDLTGKESLGGIFVFEFIGQLENSGCRSGIFETCSGSCIFQSAENAVAQLPETSVQEMRALKERQDR